MNNSAQYNVSILHRLLNIQQWDKLILIAYWFAARITSISDKIIISLWSVGSAVIIVLQKKKDYSRRDRFQMKSQVCAPLRRSMSFSQFSLIYALLFLFAYLSIRVHSQVWNAGIATWKSRRIERRNSLNCARRPALISVENVEWKDSSRSEVVKKRRQRPVETLLIFSLILLSATCRVNFSQFFSAPHIYSIYSFPPFSILLLLFKAHLPRSFNPTMWRWTRIRLSLLNGAARRAFYRCSLCALRSPFKWATLFVKDFWRIDIERVIENVDGSSIVQII